MTSKPRQGAVPRRTHLSGRWRAAVVPRVSSGWHNPGMQVRQLRLQRGWSQEQLAERCGLSVRTIQRIENGRPPGLASAAALAQVFHVDVGELGEPQDPDGTTPSLLGSTLRSLRQYADFGGHAERAEYWWFMLFVVLAAAAATLISEVLGAVVVLLLLVPLLAAGARRLHDAGHSGWWQLLALVPFGGVVPLLMLALPTASRDV